MRHAGQETEQNMGAGYSAVNEQCGKRKPPPWKRQTGPEKTAGGPEQSVGDEFLPEKKGR